MSEISRLLAAGNGEASSQLLPLVYEELRKLAAAFMVNEKPGQSLDATALVHEAYLRLAKPADGAKWDGRRHFFAAAATAMRRILIDNARRKARLRHGGGEPRAPLSDVASPDADEQLLALDEALNQLAAEDEQAAKIVELHHFAGLSHEVVAETLGITVYQARQKWAYARAWLQAALGG